VVPSLRHAVAAGIAGSALAASGSEELAVYLDANENGNARPAQPSRAHPG